MKKAVIFLSLFSGHWFLDSTPLLILYCCLGILLAVWTNSERFLMLTLLASELAIGIIFILFQWNYGQLQFLSDNMQMPFIVVAGVPIIINLISAFLVTLTSLYVTRLLLSIIYGRWMTNNHRVKVKTKAKISQAESDLSAV
ncbi:MAG: hypothetical protein JXR41_12690 [Bacteroidales bacterium]|nr:hypothetical protein [Bacteroidales bacterium]